MLRPSRLQADENRIEAKRASSKGIRKPKPNPIAADRGMHNFTEGLIGERRRPVARRIRSGPGCDPTSGTVIFEGLRRQATDRQCHADNGTKWKFEACSQDQPSLHFRICHTHPVAAITHISRNGAIC